MHLIYFIKAMSCALTTTITLTSFHFSTFDTFISTYIERLIGVDNELSFY